MRLPTTFSPAFRPALLAGVLALVLPCLEWRVAAVEAGQMSEAQVKAAFLLNFTRFVEWPPRSDGPLLVGIAGDDAFADIVAQTARGRIVDGREIHTRRLAMADDPSTCQVVFVGASRPRDATEVMQRIRGPVLTVGESVQFLRDGGMVRFHVENKRVAFEISQKNAERAGLKVGSQLMMLSR